jgi:hypothetical protein
MDSQSRTLESRAFEIAQDAGVGTPLRCPRVMSAQTLTVATPVSLLGSLLTALLYIPRAAMLAPAAIRMTRRRA